MNQTRAIKALRATGRAAFNCFLYASLFSAITCSAQQTTQIPAPVSPTPPEPPHTSRLRMFGHNGASAVLYRGSACVKDFWSADGEKASGGLGSAFGSFFGSVSNRSLGIPETETSRKLSSRDSLLSKVYFREYVIPAGQPSSMRLGFQDVSPFYLRPPRSVSGIIYRPEYVDRSCHGAISFVPEAGKDYEVAFSFEGNTCHAALNEVVGTGDAVELIPVPVSIAPDC